MPCSHGEALLPRRRLANTAVAGRNAHREVIADVNLPGGINGKSRHVGQVNRIVDIGITVTDIGKDHNHARSCGTDPCTSSVANIKIAVNGVDKNSKWGSSYAGPGKLDTNCRRQCTG